MNRIQRAVLLVGAILVMLQGVFPPWGYRNGPYVERAGYAPIWSPPTREPRVFNPFNSVAGSYSVDYVEIDFSRVGLTLATTILVCVGLVLAFKNRTDRPASAPEA